MRPLSTLYLAVVLGCLVISPAAAETSEDESARHEAARVAGEEGLKLYSSTRWQEAFDAFQRAETAFHAPTLVLFMAHCQRMLGKLVDARALYLQVSGETLGPGAPNQFLTAQIVARGELERLRRRLPRLVITIKGAPADSVRITLDGAPLPASSGIAQDVDPGEHALTATAQRAAPIHRTITLNEGATAELELAFAAQPEPPSTDPPAPSATISPAPPPPPPPPPSPPLSPSAFRGVPISAFIAFGVGAAGLGVGAVTGAIALGEARDIKSTCQLNRHCPVTDQAKADVAGRLGDASTIGFVVGGAGIVTGVLLLLLRPSGGAAHGPESSPVSVRLGPGIVTVKGAF